MESAAQQAPAVRGLPFDSVQGDRRLRPAAAGPDAAAAGDGGAGSPAPPMNPRMSFFVTRPAMPVPCNLRNVDVVFLRNLPDERRRTLPDSLLERGGRASLLATRRLTCPLALPPAHGELGPAMAAESGRLPLHWRKRCSGVVPRLRAPRDGRRLVRPSSTPWRPRQGQLRPPRCSPGPSRPPWPESRSRRRQPETESRRPLYRSRSRRAARPVRRRRRPS